MYIYIYMWDFWKAIIFVNSRWIVLFSTKDIIIINKCTKGTENDFFRKSSRNAEKNGAREDIHWLQNKPHGNAWYSSGTAIFYIYITNIVYKMRLYYIRVVLVIIWRLREAHTCTKFTISYFFFTYYYRIYRICCTFSI